MFNINWWVQRFILSLENVKQARVFNRSMCCITSSTKRLLLCLFYTHTKKLICFSSLWYSMSGVTSEVNLFTVVRGNNGPVRGHKQRIVSLRPFFIKRVNGKYKTTINCKKRGLSPKHTACFPVKNLNPEEKVLHLAHLKDKKCMMLLYGLLRKVKAWSDN